MKNIEHKPHDVKLFIGMLSQDIDLFDELGKNLREIYGPIDLESPVWSWKHTGYYKEEMGNHLKRKFIFFKNLIDPIEISGIKIQTGKLEKEYLNENAGRSINLDPGYLDSAKLVLVSTKDFSHRIYLDKGIYGEVTLYFSGDDYKVLPYTYPDFKKKKTIALFKKAREVYRKHMRL